MLKSYLAIIDAYGLRSIYEEQAGTTKFLIRQIDNTAAPARLLVWAVVSGEVMVHIQDHLRLGDGQAAWQILQAQSHQLGSVAATTQPLLRA